MPRLLLGLLFGLLVAGCDATDPSPLGRSSGGDEDGERRGAGLPPALRLPLLPLEVGNAWVFEHTRVRPDGAVTVLGSDTLHVVADTLIGGETWYRLEATSVDGRACLGGYYTTRGGDVWRWADPSDPEESPYRQYRYPAEAGTSYPYQKPEATATATVRDTDAPLTVSAGTFPSYWYDVDYDELAGYAVSSATPPVERYLAPGVGFVRFESGAYSLNDGGEFYLYATLRWDLSEVIAP